MNRFDPWAGMADGEARKRAAVRVRRPGRRPAKDGMRRAGGRWLPVLASAALIAGVAWRVRDMAEDGRIAYYRDYYLEPGLEARLTPAAYRDGRGAQHSLLTVSGRIGPAAAPWLARQIARHGLVKGDTIMLRSTGGDLQQAMIMGMEIRKHALNTSIGELESRADGGSVLRPSYCASACVAVFAAGVRRSAVPGSRLGLHRFKQSGVPDDASDQAQMMMGRLMGYFGKMGVSSEVVAMASTIDSRDILWIEGRRLAELRLTNVVGR